MSPGRLPNPPRRTAHPAFGYAAALAAVALATLAALLVDRAVGAPNVSLVFVLPVVLTAASFGWGPALVAALTGVGAYNFFLIAPRYTLRVADPVNAWALLLLLTTGAVVSAVAAEARRRTMQARQAADQAQALHALARALVGEAGRAGLAARCAEALAQLFRAPAVVLVHEETGLQPLGMAGGARLSEADTEAARWVLASELATRGGAYPADSAAFDFWPVITPNRQRAVIGVSLSDREGRPETPERLVEIVGGYLAVALDREAYARQVLENRVRSASERLKADLLAAVSHDLKTPLSTILVTLQSLRRFDAHHDAGARAELLAAAEVETARLSRMVENLLDMNRIEAGALPLRPAPAPPDQLVTAALGRAAAALAGRRIVNEVSRSGPPLMVDEALFESALANLLENAAKYSPAGSEVRIRSGACDGMGYIEVLDEGPGFAGAPELLFEKFARGRGGDGRPPGTGLGLSIARGFLEAQGGRVEAANRQDRAGACVRLLAPWASAA